MKLITIVYDDARLLPQFLHHYSTLGVTEFLIGGYLDTGVIEPIKIITQGYSRKIFGISGRYDHRKDTGLRQHIAQTFVRPDEWWVVADQDEFHEYPCPLPELCAKLSQGGYSFLQSHLLDRFAADSHSRELDPYLPLWEQFPAAAYITGLLNHLDSLKVMLVRGHAQTLSGHHRPRHPELDPVLMGGLVHHFKWHGDIEKKVRKRREAIKSRGASFHAQHSNFLNFWSQNHRFPIEGELGFHYPRKPDNWPNAIFTPSRIAELRNSSNKQTTKPENHPAVELARNAQT